ncbi:unnamed protein product [Effrenium voratum]|uniref:RING-type domain-containing protein n=1 Tax=Effrenium voratum TaxID=2562239 RepID=A0AA36NJ07_9DINO|nr:unnamed protein product [Effrenium voratum]CAJ1430758.1 unnamed protein product [Effrenium voratum]
MLGKAWKDEFELPEEIQRVAVVIGETGVGKSTIVNMLYNQDSSERCCAEPSVTGNSADSVTKASSLHLCMRTGWCLVDTVGVGDPDLRQNQIVDNVRNVIRNTARGVHAVIIVMKMGRVPKASRANLVLLQKLFREEDLKSHGVLVLTHWSGELGEEEGALKEWMGSAPGETFEDAHGSESEGPSKQEASSLPNMIDKFSRVILTNNQLKGRGAYSECRQNCLCELLEFVHSRTCKIRPRPVKFKDFIYDLMLDIYEMLWGSVVTIKDLLGRGESKELPTYCGACAVCSRQIELQQACKLTCDHSFHQECVKDLTACPVCQAPVVSLFSFADFFSGGV